MKSASAFIPTNFAKQTERITGFRELKTFFRNGHCLYIFMHRLAADGNGQSLHRHQRAGLQTVSDCRLRFRKQKYVDHCRRRRERANRRRCQILPRLTGIFELLDKNSFLDGTEPGRPEIIRFPDWSLIGADFLLRGDAAIADGRLTAQARLYDIARARVIFQKKYNGHSGDVRQIARAISSDILLALTGDEGDFNTKIALVIKKKNASDIFSINYDATGLKPVTSHQSIVTSPRWSPDGRYLAFTSYKEGRPAVYLRHLPTGRERKVAAFPGLNMCGSFSPDSKKLLLTLSKDGNEEIYALDVESMKLTRLTNNYAIDVSPAWSPDGRKIAFVSNRSGTPQIFVMDAGGDNVNRLTYEGNYNTSPSWSPGGTKSPTKGSSTGNIRFLPWTCRATTRCNLLSMKRTTNTRLGPPPAAR